MGMYTEIHFNAELKRDTPEDVLSVLRYMVGGAVIPARMPDHPLFSTSRWAYMLTCDSYYFAADSRSTLRGDDIAGCFFLCVRSNLKNYEAEIEKFIDWITPYVDAGDGDFLGFLRYEETEWPTLIHHPNRLTPTSP